MFEDFDVLSYWNQLSPQAQGWVQTGGWLFVVLLGGHFVGSMVARGLRNKNFDLALRLPGAATVGGEHGMTPTFFAGMLVRLSIWGAAAWWLAHNNGRVELAGTIGLVISRAWAVAAMLVFVLALGSLLARRLIDCFEGQKSGAERRNDHAKRQRHAPPSAEQRGGRGRSSRLFVRRADCPLDGRRYVRLALDARVRAGLVAARSETLRGRRRPGHRLSRRSGPATSPSPKAPPRRKSGPDSTPASPSSRPPPCWR